MSRTTVRRRYPRYTKPGKEIGDSAFGDPWEIKDFAPDSTSVFDETWQVATTGEEGVIGQVFTFGNGRMDITAQTTRRAIGARNSQTGRVQWVPFRRGKFGTDQLPRHQLPAYTNGLQTETTPLARMLGHKNARCLSINVDESIRAKGGDPTYRSPLKKTGGFRCTPGS